MQEVEREQTRQTWLQALGLTPWVATQRLPGAAPSRFIRLPDTETATPTAAATATTATTAATTATTAAVPTAELRAILPAATPKRSAAPAATPAVIAPAGNLAVPRLSVRLAGDTLLIAEQMDAQAPEPGRDEQLLLESLARLFAKTAKTLALPCPAQPQEAREMLAGFVLGMGQQGCRRVLLCLGESGCRFLCDIQPRFTAFTLSGAPALVVSSLAEMLAEPLEHKRKSWQAMREAGLGG